MDRVLDMLPCIETCNAITAFESLIEAKEFYIHQIVDSLIELRLLRQTLDSKLNECKVTNTVGNLASITGTLLLFTPLFFIGLGTIGAGTAASIGSNVREHFIENEQKKKLINLLEKEAAAGLDYSKKLIEAMNGSSKGTLLFMKISDLKRMYDVGRGYNVPYNGINGAANAIRAGTELSSAAKVLGVVGIGFSVADIVMTWKIDNDTSVKIGKIIEEKENLLSEQKKELQILLETQKNFLKMILGSKITHKL